MQKITPCLWFDDKAEEAANFYVSIFNDSKILDVSHYGEVGPRPAGMVMTVTFQIEGQQYIALNGGPEFTFSPAISLTVNCGPQEEVDTYWDKLLEGGGEEGVCGWLTDRYGLSWQVVPTILTEMMNDPDPAKANRVTKAMLDMKKIDIAALRQAYAAAA